MRMHPLRLLSTFALAAALFAAPAALAHADSISLVVGGEPGITPAVTDAVATWMKDHDHHALLDSLLPAARNKLVDCFLASDEACAKTIVAPAHVERLMFVMVDVIREEATETNNITLTGWLFDASGGVHAAERRFCEKCRTATLAASAESLADALIGGGQHPASQGPQPKPLVGTQGPVDGSTSGASKAPYVLIGVGGAAVVAGVVLLATNESAPPVTMPQPKTLRDDTALGITVGAAGLVAVGVGVYWLMHHPHAASRPIAAATGDSIYVGWLGSF